MTGTYLRVNRGDKFENVEIEYLTPDEINELFSDREPKELIAWITHLVAQLRSIAVILDKAEVNVN